ncbi:MAG: lysostaphin resistance A-like protein [Bryobacteraceae bacterium]
MGEAPPATRFGALLRVGVFAFLELAGLVIFSQLLAPLGYLIAATLSTFAAAATANTLAVRIYERRRLPAIGLGWSAASARHLLIGFGGGAGSALVVLGGPLLVGAAEMKPSAEPASWASLGFVSFILLFGAVGEEMLFRGYGFQVLVRVAGPYATILPTSALFALAHYGNPNSTRLSVVNTLLWGVIFGCAVLRSGDLWLPIGIHFGWNWVLPLFGVNLSGFTMKTSGYVMHWKIGELWSGGDYGPEAGLLCVLVLALLFAYLFKMPIQPQRAPLMHSREEA